MEHESFENDDVAEIMNQNFVSIKVDREERPDLDDIYQKVCQMTTGQGGWPLSVFLTPDQKPFYVGTYFPALDSYGRPGFGSLLRQLAQAWKEKPSDVKKAAENFMETLQKTEKITTPSKLEKSILDEAAMNLMQIADNTYGGFGSAPKFPNAANLSFMLRYSKISKISKFSEFVFKTLNKMARGGIFDQIGGGFHRYSTDARWLVPHFEKMLYDNALLPIVYSEAYQITKDPFYLEVIQKTLNFVTREMTSPEGGFYSALDADSEGEEGKYYVWKKREIQEILGKNADVFCLYYDVTDGGNFEGHTILNNNISTSTVAFHFGTSEDDVKKIISDSSDILLELRSRRIRPGLDDKVLTSWNALAIRGMARAGRTFGNPSWIASAQRALEFTRSRMWRDGRLLATYKDGRAHLAAYLDDYAFLIAALLELMQAEFSLADLQWARELADVLGIADRSAFALADLLETPDAVAPADVVVLRRVVCCSPSGPRLLGVAAGKTRRVLLASYPRDTLATRAFSRVENLFFAVIRKRFRSYVHPPAALDREAAMHGLRRARTSKGAIWETARYEPVAALTNS